jgi:hypothetical protein
VSALVGLFVFGIVIYLSSTIPSITTVVQPVPDVDSHFDQVQALQLISAGNIINLGIFAFILTLQVRAVPPSRRSAH